MSLILSSRLAVSCSLVALFIIFFFAWQRNPGYEMSGFAVGPAAAGAGNTTQAPFYISRFASSDLDEYVHSSAVAALPSGDLISVWFAGSREGAADVKIRGARFHASAGEWGAEFVLATRESTRTGVMKPIRKLGNPVIALAPDDRLWLFYVSVSVGGWAGSAINVMVSEDFGHSWSVPRQLVTSPFLNISTLVRSTPVFHQDGSIGLPVYHEFIGKFAEYLYLDANGRLIDKFRISRGNHSLQPTIVPQDGQRAIAMLRYAGDAPGRVLASRTEDAGQTWSEPYSVDPWNPNSSLAAIATSGNGLLVALNDLRDGRFRLSLYGTDLKMDAWQPLIDLDESPDPEGDPFSLDAYRAIIGNKFRAAHGEQSALLLKDLLSSIDQRVCKELGCNFEYEYPYFIRSSDGSYHLVYSWNNMLIKHVSFNDAWLEQYL